MYIRLQALLTTQNSIITLMYQWKDDCRKPLPLKQMQAGTNGGLRGENKGARTKDGHKNEMGSGNGAATGSKRTKTRGNELC